MIVAAREPEDCVDLEVEQESFGFLLAQPGAQMAERDTVHTDGFIPDSSSPGDLLQAGCKEEVGCFRGHSRGGWSGEQEFHRFRLIARFLQEFAVGGFGQGLTSMIVLVTDQTGRDLNYRSVHGAPELFYQEREIVVRSRTRSANSQSSRS